MAMLSNKRLAPLLLAVTLLLTTIYILNSGHSVVSLNRVDSVTRVESHPVGSESEPEPLPGRKNPAQSQPQQPPQKHVPISYDKTTPPTVGCESVVRDLQRKIIEAYQVQLKGIRYINVFGYLETENKGDAAIWVAQQILLATMGITSMEACRFLDKRCDLDKFKRELKEHAPYSGIIMAGGGNFNDFYWEDQPARIQMVKAFRDYPIRAFPQSIHMTSPWRINQTKESFNSHSNLQLAARDQPSFDWLEQEFGSKAQGVTPNKVKHILTPDIVFMYGNRPDFRINTKKTHRILILAREDSEVDVGNSESIPKGSGTLDLGGKVGKVTYNKIDWKLTKTPHINGEEITQADGSRIQIPPENGKNQRAWAKATQGFEMLATADLVITDRLHGHIMSTIIGVPHILMDSKLKKNINFHNTWTKDCKCTRVADSIDEAKNFARMFFEQKNL